MSYCTPGRGAIVAVQLVTLCIVAACGRTETDPVAGGQAAAVENVEAMAQEHANMRKSTTNSSTVISRFHPT